MERLIVLTNVIGYLKSDDITLTSPADDVTPETLLLSAGWLVDVTGSYTATFFLSGAALLASAVILSAVTGIRHCRHRSDSVLLPSSENRHQGTRAPPPQSV